MSKVVIPCILACVDVVQAVVCACHRDWARTVYWTAAACLTFTTTQMKGG